MAKIRTGVFLQSERAIGLALRGQTRPETLGPYHAPLPDGGAEDLARAIAALRPAPVDRGPLRLVLPIALCDGFLRQGPRSIEADEFIAGCMRWVEEEYGVELSENDVRVCRYLYPDRQVGVVTVTRPGYVDGLTGALEARGLRDVSLLSPLDAMLLLAQALPPEAPGATRVFLHVAPDRSLALVFEGEAPAFFRGIRKRAEPDSVLDRYEQMRVAGPAARPIGDAAARALTQELARTVRFHRRTAGVESELSGTVLTGSGLDLAPLAVRIEEETGAPAFAAPPFGGVRPGGTPEEQAWLRERWSEVALPAAAALPNKIAPNGRLAEIPSRMAEIITPRRVAVAVAVLYVLILAIVFFALKAHRAVLVRSMKKVRLEVAAKQRELMQRQRQDTERKRRLRMMRMLLRMKYQGVFAAKVLGGPRQRAAGAGPLPGLHHELRRRHRRHDPPGQRSPRGRGARGVADRVRIHGRPPVHAPRQERDPGDARAGDQARPGPPRAPDPRSAERPRARHGRPPWSPDGRARRTARPGRTARPSTPRDAPGRARADRGRGVVPLQTPRRGQAAVAGGGNDMNPTLTRMLVLFGAITLGCYWFALGPEYEKLGKRRRELRTLEKQMDGMGRRLRRLPPVTEEERKAWQYITYRADKTLVERPDLLAALVELATVLQSSGARVMVASIGNPPKEPERPTGSVAPRRMTRGLMGSELESSALPDRSSPEEGGASTPSAPRPEPLRPQPISRGRPRAPGILTGNPSATAGSFETPEIEEVEGRDVTWYPVSLDVSGPYSAWPESFNELTRRRPPVLISRIEGKRSNDKGEMKMQVVVPTLPAEPKRPHRVAPPRFYLPRAMATLYGFPSYVRKIKAPWPSTLGNPFPRSKSALAGGGSGMPAPSIIMSRAGQFVAVIGGKRYRVGDKVGGSKIARITRTTVFYAQ